MRHHVLPDNQLVGEADSGLGIVEVELASDRLAPVLLVGDGGEGLHHQAGQTLFIPHPEIRLENGAGVKLVGRVGEHQVRDNAAIVGRLQVGVVVLASAPAGLGGGGSGGECHTGRFILMAPPCLGLCYILEHFLNSVLPFMF